MKREEERDSIEQAIDEVLRRAPALDASQRDRLAAVLRPVRTVQHERAA